MMQFFAVVGVLCVTILAWCAFYTAMEFITNTKKASKLAQASLSRETFDFFYGDLHRRICELEAELATKGSKKK